MLDGVGDGVVEVLVGDDDVSAEVDADVSAAVLTAVGAAVTWITLGDGAGVVATSRTDIVLLV